MFIRPLRRAPLPYLLLGVVVCSGVGSVALGCGTTTDGSEIGFKGYIFTQESDGERRWLHLPVAPEPTMACYYDVLPPAPDLDWSVAELDPAVHRAATELIQSPEARERYEADTAASIKERVRVCLEREGQSDWCYFPSAGLSRFDGPQWLFWFGPEATLSPESALLVETLLAVHDECWTNGSPAPDY